jgi:hypothetical protein
VWPVACCNKYSAVVEFTGADLNKCDSCGRVCSPTQTAMPEGGEIDIFREHVQRSQKTIAAKHGTDSLRLLGVCTDSVAQEVPGMRSRQDRILQYAKTLSPKILAEKTHRDWATRLCRLAHAIPDTPGLLIRMVRGNMILVRFVCNFSTD